MNKWRINEIENAHENNFCLTNVIGFTGKNAIACSFDTSLIAYSCGSTVVLWDWKSDTFKYLSQHMSFIQSLEFNSSSTKLISCDRNSICVWSIDINPPKVTQYTRIEDTYTLSNIALSSSAEGFIGFLQNNEQSYTLSIWCSNPQLKVLASTEDVNINDYNELTDVPTKIIPPSLCFCNDNTTIIIAFPKSIIIYQFYESYTLIQQKVIPTQKYCLIEKEILISIQYSADLNQIICLSQFYGGKIEQAQVSYCGSLLFLDSEGNLKDAAPIGLPKCDYRIMTSCLLVEANVIVVGLNDGDLLIYNQKDKGWINANHYPFSIRNKDNNSKLTDTKGFPITSIQYSNTTNLCVRYSDHIISIYNLETWEIVQSLVCHFGEFTNAGLFCESNGIEYLITYNMDQSLIYWTVEITNSNSDDNNMFSHKPKFIVDIINTIYSTIAYNNVSITNDGIINKFQYSPLCIDLDNETSAHIRKMNITWLTCGELGNYIYLCSNNGIFWIYEIETGEMVVIIDLIDICGKPDNISQDSLYFYHFEVTYDELFALFTVQNYCLLLDIYHNSRSVWFPVYSIVNQLYGEFLENPIEEGKLEKESFIISYKQETKFSVIISGWNKEEGDELVVEELKQIYLPFSPIASCVTLNMKLYTILQNKELYLIELSDYSICSMLHLPQNAYNNDSFFMSIDFIGHFLALYLYQDVINLSNIYVYELDSYLPISHLMFSDKINSIFWSKCRERFTILKGDGGIYIYDLKFDDSVIDYSVSDQELNKINNQPSQSEYLDSLNAQINSEIFNSPNKPINEKENDKSVILDDSIQYTATKPPIHPPAKSLPRIIQDPEDSDNIIYDASSREMSNKQNDSLLRSSNNYTNPPVIKSSAANLLSSGLIRKSTRDENEQTSSRFNDDSSKKSTRDEQISVRQSYRDENISARPLEDLPKRSYRDEGLSARPLEDLPKRSYRDEELSARPLEDLPKRSFRDENTSARPLDEEKSSKENETYYTTGGTQTSSRPEEKINQSNHATQTSKVFNGPNEVELKQTSNPILNLLLSSKSGRRSSIKNENNIQPDSTVSDYNQIYDTIPTPYDSVTELNRNSITNPIYSAIPSPYNNNYTSNRTNTSQNDVINSLYSNLSTPQNSIYQSPKLQVDSSAINPLLSQNVTPNSSFTDNTVNLVDQPPTNRTKTSETMKNNITNLNQQTDNPLFDNVPSPFEKSTTRSVNSSHIYSSVPTPNNDYKSNTVRFSDRKNPSKPPIVPPIQNFPDSLDEPLPQYHVSGSYPSASTLSNKEYSEIPTPSLSYKPKSSHKSNYQSPPYNINNPLYSHFPTPITSERYDNQISNRVEDKAIQFPSNKNSPKLLVSSAQPTPYSSYRQNSSHSSIPGNLNDDKTPSIPVDNPLYSSIPTPDNSYRIPTTSRENNVKEGKELYSTIFPVINKTPIQSIQPEEKKEYISSPPPPPLPPQPPSVQLPKYQSPRLIPINNEIQTPFPQQPSPPPPPPPPAFKSAPTSYRESSPTNQTNKRVDLSEYANQLKFDSIKPKVKPVIKCEDLAYLGNLMKLNDTKQSNIDKSSIYLAAHYSEKMKLGLPKRKSMQFPKMPDPFAKLNNNT